MKERTTKCKGIAKFRQICHLPDLASGGRKPLMEMTRAAEFIRGLMPPARLQLLALLSTIKVTGPSLTSSTFIMAPKRPVATGMPWARTALMKHS